MSEANQNRLKQVLAAYGADPARWPDDERAALKREIAETGSSELPEWREAREIDAILSSAPEVPVSDRMIDQILMRAQEFPKAEVVPFAAKPSSVVSTVRRIGLREAVPVGVALAASLLMGVFAGLDEQIGSFATVASLETSSPALEDKLWSFDPFNMNEGEPQ